MNGIDLGNGNIFNKLNYDSFLELATHLEVKDLMMLASSCKTLRASQTIWDVIAYKCNRPKSISTELIKYFNTPQEVTVYHLLTGIHRRSLSKNRYTVHPTTKLVDIRNIAIKSAMQQMSHKIKDEEHCEIRLPRRNVIDTNDIPVYSVYKENKEPIVLSKEQIKQNAVEFIAETTIYAIPAEHACDISTFLTPIYNAVKEASEVQATQEEVGPFGLFSLKGLNWRPLNSIEFFNHNHSLDCKKDISSLTQRSILIITDITHTEQDTNFDIVDHSGSDDRDDRDDCCRF